MKKKLICIIGGITISVGLLIILIVPALYNHFNKKDIVVLAYHHFLDEDIKEKYDKGNGFVVTTENFELQLKHLKEQGYQSMTSEELKCYLNKKCDLKGKKVLITMDDGNISSYYIALPLLEKYGYSSINFVIAGRVKETSEEWGKYDKYYFLGKDLINDIKDNHPLMEIGAHSYSLHGKIDGKSPLDVYDYEKLLEDSNKAMEILNTKVYCFPFGNYNQKLTEAIKTAGFEMSFTFNPFDFVDQNDNLYSIPRIEVRGDYSIEEFADAISNHKSIIRFWKDVAKKILGR